MRPHVALPLLFDVFVACSSRSCGELRVGDAGHFDDGVSLVQATTVLKFGPRHSSQAKLTASRETSRVTSLDTPVNFLQETVDVTAVAPPSNATSAAPAPPAGHLVHYQPWHPAHDQPLHRRELYFRSVSVTLICIMVLMVVCVVVYVATTLSRNIDELAGHTKPSLVTEGLTVVSRSTSFAPMMCALFLACRMEVLAATHGLGDPSIVAKLCMCVASAGLILQVAISMFLPLGADSSLWELVRFSAVAGEPTDVHPRLLFLKTETVEILQAVSIFGIYGGATGVFIGTLIYGGPQYTISWPVLVASLIGILYYATYFVWWLVNFRPMGLGGPGSWCHMLLGDHAASILGSACQAAALGPMLAVLLLASRMRWLQIDAPTGDQPVWLNFACYCLFVFYGFYVAVAGCVGRFGEEVHGYYGTSKFVPGSRLQGWLLAAQAGIGVCVSLVFWGIFFAPSPNGEVLALSHTCRCVCALAGAFFVNYGLRCVASFLQAYLGWKLKTLEDTTVAAGVGMSLMPQIILLFLGCRMRALQITAGRGEPQSWAQVAMTAAVLSLLIQTFCCLVLPVFTGLATQVGEDGSAKYDLRPMIGAYTVTWVKYLALAGLVIGMFLISLAVFLMTPETAHGGPDVFQNTRRVIVFITVMFCVVLIAVILSSAKVIGLAVKLGIEAVDTTLLGAEVTVRSALLSLCRGFVNVDELVLHNPVGRTWESEHLLKVDKAVVKINLWRLIKTYAGEFEITGVELKGVNVVFEKAIGLPSNVEILWTNIEKIIPKDPIILPDVLILRSVSFEGIGASLFITSKRLGGEVDVHFELDDVNYPNFQEDFIEKMGTGAKVETVILVLVRTFLKTIRSNPYLLAKIAKAGEHVLCDTVSVAERACVGKSKNVAEYVFGRCG